MPPKLAAIVPKLTDEAVLDALRGSSLVTRGIEEQAAELLAHRSADVKRLEEIERAAEKTLPKLNEARNAALVEFRKAESAMSAAIGIMARAEHAAAREIARGRWVEADQKSVAASLAYTSEHDEIERRLRESCSPAIASFKSEMRDEIDVLRKSAIVEEAEAAPNVITTITGRKPNRAPRSNAFALTIRLFAILQASEEADRLALASDQSVVAAELDRLRRSLPAADTIYPAPRFGNASAHLLSDLRAGVPIDEAIKRYSA